MFDVGPAYTRIDPERTRPLYEAIATALQALRGCRSDNANESQQSWAPRWEDFIERAAQELPSGSGFDVHPTIDTDEIKPGRFVIRGSYHNMDEYGGYCGWSDYTITVTPSFDGINLRIVGGNSDFKDYCHDCFDQALHREFPQSAFHTGNME